MAARLAALLGMTLLCLLLGEAALRVLAPLPPGQRATLEQELPGLAPEIVYERNGFGLRGLSLHSRAKPPGVVRVLCLGASTTDQPTQSTADTWCARLELALAPELAARGLRIETAAYGRGGLRTAGLLHWARRELRDFDPDLVVTLLGVNDLSLNGGPGYRYDGRLEPPPETAGAALERRCLALSELCRRVFLLRDRAHLRGRLEGGRAVQWHSRKLPELRRERAALPERARPLRDPDPLREFSDASRELIAFLREAGAEVVVLGQPVLWKPDLAPAEEAALWLPLATPEGPVRAPGAWLEAEMRRYNEVQRAHAERLGASYLDLDARIPKDLEHYFDDCHFTDRASARVAEELLPLVREGVAERGRT